MPEVDKNQGIKVITRASGVLRVLGEDTSGLSLGQIAKRTELPRSTVQRIVGALAEEGFVSASEGAGGIRLGPQIQTLAEAARVDLAMQMRPIMQAISDETGETVDLAVLEGGRMRFIDQVVGTQRLRTVSTLGESFPLTTTANGKAALSVLPEAEAEKLMLAEIEAGFSPGPLGDVLAETERVRQSGIARDENEHTDGISALGFALADPSGRVYAVSVPVPSSRYARVSVTLKQVMRRHYTAAVALRKGSA